PSSRRYEPHRIPLYTRSLHDALPIFAPVDCRWPREQESQQSSARRLGERQRRCHLRHQEPPDRWTRCWSPFPHHLGSANRGLRRDRKSTRLNSSHVKISYAVFCLKKK